MISVNELKEKWDEEAYPLIEYDKKIVDNLQVPMECKEFLIEVGLPEAAVPFLTFESSDDGGLLTLREKYDIDKDYIYIGFTGEGDIIAIEDKSGVIIVINHETDENVYMNSSIGQLLESLFEYSEFVKRIKNANGRQAFLNRECSKEELEVIKNKLNSIDNNSIQNDSFWWNEISLFE